MSDKLKIKRWLDIENVTHVEGGTGNDMTLCGLALEGENGDTEMLEITSRINCPDCLHVINHARKIPKAWQARP